MITTITNSSLTAQINHLGAELSSLKSNINVEFIWEGNPAFWGKHSPVLFPIVGTLKNDTYKYNDVEHHLSRHGFARDMVFELIEKNENSATFTIQSTTETIKKYPFDFELQIIYTLEGNSLTIAYKVVNNSKTQIPFSLGAHPAFALAGNFEDYDLQFEKDETLEYNLLQNNLISNETKILAKTNKLVPLKYELFKDDALIFKSLQSQYITISKHQTPFLRIHYAAFPNLGIWTMINAPFLCIEPWFGYSDSVNNNGNIMDKEGIQILDPDQTFNTEFSIEIL